MYIYFKYRAKLFDLWLGLKSLTFMQRYYLFLNNQIFFFTFDKNFSFRIFQNWDLELF